MSHSHAPAGAADTYNAAKLARCSCGVDLVSYLAPEGARYNWEEWRPTSLGDPCLSCGGYETPSCCKAEEERRCNLCGSNVWRVLHAGDESNCECEGECLRVCNAIDEDGEGCDGVAEEASA